MGFNGRGDQQKFAELLGVDRGRWNNIECGAPLSKEMALRIVRKFPGVTLDWLFLGRTEGLTAEMARMLSGPSKGNDAELVAVKDSWERKGRGGRSEATAGLMLTMRPTGAHSHASGG